jgi:DNA-binding MarR family transcriptional regulator
LLVKVEVILKKLRTSFAKAEDSPGFVLWKASNFLQRLHSACLKDLNVTPTQFSLMTCLVFLSQTEKVTPSRIVAFTGMDKMMVSDLIKTLEKKGLLQKMPNPQDGRSFLVEPTSMGETVTNSAVHKIEAMDREFFGKVKNLKFFHEDLLALVNDSNSVKT